MARSLGLLIFLVVVWRPAAGQLVVISGQSAGYETHIADFVYGRGGYDVVAQLAVSRAVDWDDITCPPRYVGGGDLRGKLVLYLLPSKCTRYATAQAMQAEGAVGALLWSNHFSRNALSFIPGKAVYLLEAGDGDAPHLGEFIVAEVAGAMIDDIVDEVDGGGDVRVRVRDDAPNEWVMMWESAAWVAWRVILAFQSIEVLEVAACGLYSFVRHSGFRVDIAQAIFGLEIVAGLIRLTFVVTDPYWSEGHFTEQVLNYFLTLDVAIGAMTTTLFLFYFLAGAEQLGVATLAVDSKAPSVGLVAMGCIFVLTDLVMGILFAELPNTRTAGADSSLKFRASGILINTQTLLSTFIYPVAVLIICILVSRRAQRHLHMLPSALLSRVLLRLQLSIVWSTVSAAAVLPFIIVIGRPWGIFWVTLIWRFALNCTSYIQVTAFQPVGAAVVVGPLRRARLYFYARAWQVAEVLAIGSKTQVAPSWPSLAAPATGQPAHLRLGLALAFLQELEAAGQADDAMSTDAVALHLGAQSGANMRDRNLSLCEVCREARTLGGLPAVGDATVLVVHARAAPFKQLLRALENYAAVEGLGTDAHFWIDAFSTRTGDAPRGVDVSRAVGVVRDVARVAVVAGDWRDAACLKRAWCVYELALSAGVVPLPQGQGRGGPGRPHPLLNTEEAQAQTAARATPNDESSLDAAGRGLGPIPQQIQEPPALRSPRSAASQGEAAEHSPVHGPRSVGGDELPSGASATAADATAVPAGTAAVPGPEPAGSDSAPRGEAEVTALALPVGDAAALGVSSEAANLSRPRVRLALGAQQRADLVLSLRADRRGTERALCGQVAFDTAGVRLPRDKELMVLVAERLFVATPSVSGVGVDGADVETEVRALLPASAGEPELASGSEAAAGVLPARLAAVARDVDARARRTLLDALALEVDEQDEGR